ncbi:unnamed protein product [Ilex paraguariensis]|uniref:Uncharacterized protein n=1 Tax=Ilex paraguariensis TaxID=185542 RepID=A0ABC8UDL2_9AQUA
MDMGTRKYQSITKRKGNESPPFSQGGFQDNGETSKQQREMAVLHPMIVVEPVIQNGAVEEVAMHNGEAADNPTSQQRKEVASTSSHPENERQSIEQRT